MQFAHYRFPPETKHKGRYSPQGGATVAISDDKVNGRYYAAAAYCCPTDNFNFRIGRKIAEGRLMQALTETKEPNGDTHFCSIEGESRDSFFFRVHDFMVDVMELIPNGQAQ